MITHKGTRPIKTERISLRKILPGDAEMMYEFMSDPEVLRYEDMDPHPNAEFTRGYISYLTGDYKSDSTYCWGIERDKELIGFIMVVGVQEWNGVLAYYLKRSCWSKGYTAEAAKAVIKYMFDEVGIARISAKHSTKNPASGKVLQKVGMNYMGHVRENEYYVSKSEWQDCDFYSICNR